VNPEHGAWVREKRAKDRARGPFFTHLPLNSGKAKLLFEESVDIVGAFKNKNLRLSVAGSPFEHPFAAIIIGMFPSTYV
jgi:hypothetical protein